jgi:hypothetical protein
VGEYKSRGGRAIVTVRRDGDRLFVKVQGNMPEGPLVARSETRFGAPWRKPPSSSSSTARDKVTGAMVDQFGGNATAIPLGADK